MEMEGGGAMFVSVDDLVEMSNAKKAFGAH
jgi:hypothetical protein